MYKSSLMDLNKQIFLLKYCVWGQRWINGWSHLCLKMVARSHRFSQPRAVIQASEFAPEGSRLPSVRMRFSLLWYSFWRWLGLPFVSKNKYTSIRVLRWPYHHHHSVVGTRYAAKKSTRHISRSYSNMSERLAWIRFTSKQEFPTLLMGGRGDFSYTNEKKLTLERLSRVMALTYSGVILPHEATPNHSTCRFAPPVRKCCPLEIHKVNRPLTNGRFLCAIPRALISIKQTPHFTLESSNTLPSCVLACADDPFWKP